MTTKRSSVQWILVRVLVEGNLRQRFRLGGSLWTIFRAVSVAACGGAVRIVAPSTTRACIATGARSRNLPFVSSDAINIWDYKTAMTPPKLPSSLVIIGSGAIGMEFASFYNDLGVNVTVVEALNTILPNEDE